METESIGVKRCKMLIEILKNQNKNIFNKAEINDFVARHIGMSKMTQDRYFYALLKYNFIKKTGDNEYAIL